MSEYEDVYVGRRALEEKLVTDPQIFECLLEIEEEKHARTGQVVPRALGVLLVHRGYLKEQDYARIKAGKEMDPSFGKLVVSRKLATQPQVEECLKVQHASRRQGKTPRRLGEIMVEKGYLTAAQVEQVLTFHPGKTNFLCASCGLGFSVQNPDPGLTYPCIKCGGMLEAVGTRRREGPSPVDVAAALFIRQKSLMQRETLREAELFQREVSRYGIPVPLLEVIRRRKLLPWQVQQQLDAVDLAKVVTADDWRRQAVPGYKVREKISEGGYAAIFAAETYFSKEKVALKILRKEFSRDPVALGRFRQEARLLMRLEHPHIVRATEFGEYRGIHYMTMEFVEGRALDLAVKEDGPLRPAEAVKLVRQLAKALLHLQREGYIHRDVKPENVLVDPKGNAKLCDLGFATEIRWRGTGVTEFTPGTPAYVSPEQARGEVDLKVGTDIYSVGLTLYFMLTGRPPFRGESADRILAQRFADGVAAPDFSALQAPDGLVWLLKKMLHPERTARFSTWADVLAALPER